jgi:hypothetical protein
VALRYRLVVDGAREAAKRIDDVGLRARRPEPALRAPATARDLMAGERRRFAQARGWRRIGAEWVAEKRRRGLDPRIMRATGKLEDALTNATGGVRATAFNAQLTWGIRAGQTDLFYAQVQARRGRRAVVIDPPAREAIAQRTQRFIAEGFV